jgi:hypothetical protein
VLEELITEQVKYHKDRKAVAQEAGQTLERWGVGFFFVVCACVGLKLASVHLWGHPDWAVGFAFVATVLPAASAAFVGVRAYAELQLLAEQSRHMAAELDRAHARVARLDPTRTLVSQDIGGEAALVATLMLQDLEGWARLFRVKAMEP